MRKCAYCGHPSDSVYCDGQCQFLAEKDGYSEDGLPPEERVFRDGSEANLREVAQYVNCGQLLNHDLLLFFDELELRTVGDLQQTDRNKLEGTIMAMAKPEILRWVEQTLRIFQLAPSSD